MINSQKEPKDSDDQFINENMVERKLVRFTAAFICIFSLFCCVAVWFLPGIERGVEAFGAGIIQKQLEREERYAMLKEMSGLEIMDYNTQQVQEKAEEGSTEVKEEEITYTQDKKMRIELPKNTEGKDVLIVPDYIGKQIAIKIPGADENYLYDYQIIGKADEIANLDYISENGSGTIVLSMNTIVDAESSFDKNYLYLDFLIPNEAHDRIVVVDAGHGGEPGAVAGDIYEKDITLAIVQKIKAVFEEDEDKDIGIYCTRLEDKDVSLSDRVNLANNMGADLFVSIHINSIKGRSDVEGIEVMYDELAPDTEFDSKDFAQICLDEAQAAMGAKKRSLINGNKIYIIRNAQMPAALIEVGFINNPFELARLVDDSYQLKAAQGICSAIKKSIHQLDKLEKESSN